MPNYTHSDWYDQSLPASPAAAPAAPPRQPQRKRRRKKGPGKIISITVCAVTLVAACVYAFTDRSDGDGVWMRDPVSAIGETLLPPPPNDYRSFFEEYYASAETTTERSLVQRERGDPAVTVYLVSAEGRETLDLPELYRQTAPSIVGIKAGFPDSSGYSWGSGIVLSADGYILTNQHICSGASTASVLLSDGTEWEAALIGEDYQTDLAVLHIDRRGLTPAEFGDSGTLSIGDPVAAIGNPMGAYLSDTMTDGIISGLDRDVTVNGRKMTLLQTNAAMNEGSSGGPLLNMYGQVVGVVNMKLVNAYYGGVPIEGLGFAIPSATVKTVADQLISDGAVLGRPALGVVLGAIPTEIAEYYEIPKGLYVYSVNGKSDVARQGIRAGDILLCLDGQEVHTTGEVLQPYESYAVGDKVTLTIWRDGNTFERTVTLCDQSELG